MKHRFVDYNGKWYLIPAHEFTGFLEMSYDITCAEDRFNQWQNAESALELVATKQGFEKTYGKYKIDVHLSRYAFENPHVDDGDEAVVIGYDEDGQHD